MFGKTRRKGERIHTYYACVTNREHHRDQPWYPDHPKTMVIREDYLLPIIGTFFAERVLGANRALFLDHPAPAAARSAEVDQAQPRLRARLEQLSRAQANLFAQLESYQPTGDETIDTEWRTTLQQRFATITSERNVLRQKLAEAEGTAPPLTADPDAEAELLAHLPCTAQDLTLLPEADQRRLYDAFHLQARYNRATDRLTLRVTISAATVDALAREVGELASPVASAPAGLMIPPPRPTPSGSVSHLVRDLPRRPS